jgi:hypothetical protein
LGKRQLRRLSIRDFQGNGSCCNGPEFRDMCDFLEKTILAFDATKYP